MLSKLYIYMLLTNCTNMFLIPWPLRIFQRISLLPPWKLQNTGQWHVNIAFGTLLLPHFNFGQKTLTITLGIASECVYTTFFWTSTSHTLCQLPEDILFRCFVYCTKCSIYPAVVFSRWRLWEWFQHSWLTNTFTKNTMHTPHFQHRTCILWPSTHYTLPPSCHTALWLTTNPSKTSVPPPIIYFQQFREWLGSKQYSRTLRWRRRFPNSTYGWWTLDNRYGTWKNILYTWKWVTQQCMSIPMPLWE